MDILKCVHTQKTQVTKCLYISICLLESSIFIIWWNLHQCVWCVIIISIGLSMIFPMDFRKIIFENFNVYNISGNALKIVWWCDDVYGVLLPSYSVGCFSFTSAPDACSKSCVWSVEFLARKCIPNENQYMRSAHPHSRTFVYIFYLFCCSWQSRCSVCGVFGLYSPYFGPFVIHIIFSQSLSLYECIAKNHWPFLVLGIFFYFFVVKRLC